MTIVEFLHPLRGKAIRDLCLACLYFEERYSQRQSLTVEEMRSLLRRAQIPRAIKLNLADALAKSAPFVDTAGKRGKSFLWTITSSGQEHVRALLSLPAKDVEIEHDVSTLENLVVRITDKNIADYIQEAIKCLSIGALRAAVVFVWAGAVRKIQEDVMAIGHANITTSVQKYDPKMRPIKRVDDFAYIKESTLLLVAQDLGVFDKNERGILEEALDLRNKCGHPGKYRPGPKKASSFIEDVVGVVFT